MKLNEFGAFIPESNFLNSNDIILSEYPFISTNDSDVKINFDAKVKDLLKKFIILYSLKIEYIVKIYLIKWNYFIKYKIKFNF